MSRKLRVKIEIEADVDPSVPQDIVDEVLTAQLNEALDDGLFVHGQRPVANITGAKVVSGFWYPREDPKS